MSADPTLTSELPLAERRRRRREISIGLVVLAVILALVVLQPLAGATQGVGDSGLFLLLNLVTVILIVLLFFLIGRNVWKLVGERRRGILGSHLNLKFVGAFVWIALLTSLGLFAASSFFVTTSIESWFGLQVERALEASEEVAESYYGAAEKNALFYGNNLAKSITEGQLLREDRLQELTQWVAIKQREYNLGVVEIFSATGEELVTAVNPEIPVANFARPDADFVLEALHGRPATSVAALDSGDVIRGAVPIASTFRADEAVGVVVVNYFVPISLTRKVADIRSTLLGYRSLQPAAGHIRSAYQLELFLAFLVVLLLATWLGFRLAKGVTTPIRALAEGTAEVARGNLDVVVEPAANDEIGFLVESFNRMTRDLREARAGIEHSAAELERRRRYTEIVLRNIGAGVISLAADGRVNTVNPSAERLLGLPPGTPVIGRPVEEVLSRAEHLAIVQELQGELRSGVRENIRRQIQVPLRGEVLTLLVTLTLLKDEEGRAHGTVVVFDDYSQLVRAQRMAAWREVARRIAHEIKNPLTPIQLSAQRLRRRFRSRLAAAPEEVRVFDECVDVITAQVDTLKMLTNEFSNFARLPAAKLESGDVNRVVEEAVASYAETEGVVFKTDLAPQLPLVDVDRDQMRRALTNLIDNAIAAVRQAVEKDRGGELGQVELRTAYDAPLQMVRLEVADNGVGVPAAERRRVFEPYYSTKRHGTGLGLAIVSRIVTDHRGYIRVHENRPRGARFLIELPVRGA